MKRKEFIKLAVGLGVCCCGGTMAMAKKEENENADLQELNSKIGFMQKRMALLIRALDEPTRRKVLETMGRECAKESGSFIDRYRGKPEEFLKMRANSGWRARPMIRKKAPFELWGPLIHARVPS